MKRLMTAVLAAAVLPGIAAAAEWNIDSSHSTASFTVRHLTVSNVRGEFGKVEGTVDLDPKDVTKSTAKATIDVSTINTREPKRDEHLKSPEFFDVQKYPSISFTSKKIAKAGKDKLKVTGDLTIRDVTKEVVLEVSAPAAEVKDPWGMTRRGVQATTTINRFDYGLKWDKTIETGGLVVGKEVKIELDLSLVKKPEGEAPKM